MGSSIDVLRRRQWFRSQKASVASRVGEAGGGDGGVRSSAVHPDLSSAWRDAQEVLEEEDGEVLAQAVLEAAREGAQGALH